MDDDGMDEADAVTVPAGVPPPVPHPDIAETIPTSTRTLATFVAFMPHGPLLEM
jgi:hypothetical protein